MVEKYSVLMAVYKNDDSENLKQALLSMINQSMVPDEIVLVEDGPLTDDLYGAISGISEMYPYLLHAIGYEENHGLGFALQFGLDHCRNDFIARMDSDDISTIDRCEKQLNYLLDNPSVGIVGGQIAEFIDDPSNIIGYRNVPLEDHEIRGYMKSRCPFNHPSVMFRKDAVMAAGNYQPWFYNEDYYLWIRMLLADIEMSNLPDVLVYFRAEADLYQRRGGMKYFKSEAGIQKYMLDNRIIGRGCYVKNVILRFILQVLMPNGLRAFVFKHFARSK